MHYPDPAHSRGDLSTLADGALMRDWSVLGMIRLLRAGRCSDRTAPAGMLRLPGPHFPTAALKRAVRSHSRSAGRKRGKLHMTEPPSYGARPAWQHRRNRDRQKTRFPVRFCHYLDADTSPTRGALRRDQRADGRQTNRAEAATQRMVSGYAILQLGLRRHCRQLARFISGVLGPWNGSHIRPQSRMSRTVQAKSPLARRYLRCHIDVR